MRKHRSILNALGITPWVCSPNRNEKKILIIFNCEFHEFDDVSLLILQILQSINCSMSDVVLLPFKFVDGVGANIPNTKYILNFVPIERLKAQSTLWLGLQRCSDKVIHTDFAISDLLKSAEKKRTLMGILNTQVES